MQNEELIERLVEVNAEQLREKLYDDVLKELQQFYLELLARRLA